MFCRKSDLGRERGGAWKRDVAYVQWKVQKTLRFQKENKWCVGMTTGRGQRSLREQGQSICRSGGQRNTDVGKERNEGSGEWITGRSGGGRDWWDQETRAELEAGGICALLSLWADGSSVLCTGHLLRDHSYCTFKLPQAHSLPAQKLYAGWIFNFSSFDRALIRTILQEFPPVGCVSLGPE